MEIRAGGYFAARLEESEMGVFDRLGNLGRGMVRMWSTPDERPTREALFAELDRLEDEARRITGLSARGSASSGGGDSAVDPAARRRMLLERALEDGILTPSEYRRKLGESAEAPAKPATSEKSSPPGAPRKRRL